MDNFSFGSLPINARTFRIARNLVATVFLKIHCHLAFKPLLISVIEAGSIDLELADLLVLQSQYMVHTVRHK